MSDRIIIEVNNNNGFEGGEYRRRGYFIAISSGSGYDGGGYKKHTGEWIVMSDVKTGSIFSEPIHRCRELLPAPSPATPINQEKQE